MNYQRLFALLVGLGFQEQPVDMTSPRAPRIFVHTNSDTVLLYHGSRSGAIAAADILSTEMRLKSKGLISAPLEALLEPTVSRNS